jgi:drug/metabolite transporter (DMT)-like permease
VTGPAWLWVIAIVVATLCFALLPVFVRWLSEAGYPPETITFYRFSVPAAVTLVFLGLRLRQVWGTLVGLLVGAAMGIGWVGYTIMLEQTSIAAAGMLYLSYPFFASVLAAVLLGRQPGVLGMAVIVLVVAASWLVLSGSDFEAFTWQGIGFALLSPLSLGFAVVAFTNWMSHLSPLNRLSAVTLGACLGLAPLVFLNAGDAIIPASRDIGMVLGLTLLTCLLPCILYAIAAPRLGAVNTSILGGLELPIMLFFATQLFAEEIHDPVLLAAALIVCAGVALSISRLRLGRPPVS